MGELVALVIIIYIIYKIYTFFNNIKTNLEDKKMSDQERIKKITTETIFKITLPMKT